MFFLFFLNWPNILLATHYQPAPEVETIPVEPVGEFGEFETIQSRGDSRGQRRQRSLQSDNTGRLAS